MLQPAKQKFRKQHTWYTITGLRPAGGSQQAVRNGSGLYDYPVTGPSVSSDVFSSQRIWCP